MVLRSLVFDTGTSDKFWTIDVEGAEHTVHYGRAGTAGQVKAKTFATPELALAAAEKLVAEKLRKGYRDDPAGPAGSVPAAPAPAPAAPAAPAPAAPPPPAPASPAARPAPAAAPPVGGAAGQRVPLELSPLERSLPSWLPIADPPTGSPRPSDPAALRERLRLGSHEWGWWRWTRSPVQAPMSRQEATYWLNLARRASYGTTVATQHEAALAAPEPPTAEAALALAFESQLPHGDAVAPLVTLIGPDAVLEAVLRPIDPETHRGRVLLDGARRHLLPWLDAAQRARLAEHAERCVRAELPDPEFWVGPELVLAAQLGLHELVETVVARWPDRWFAGHLSSGTYPSVALGVSSPQAYEELIRRCGLLPGDDVAVAGLLAAIGLRGLDVIEAAGLAAESRGAAEAVIGPLAERVHAAELAPVMVRLRRASRAPDVAARWLLEHPAETASGLIPLLGRSGQLAQDARDELLRMARGPRRSVLESLLPGLEKTSAELVRRRVLDAAPPPPPPLPEPPAFLAEAAARLKRAARPAWLDPDALPPLVLGGGTLTGAALETVLRVLRASTPDEPDTAVPALRAAVAAAAEAFAWELFDAWLAGGAPTKDKWALTALGVLGGDDAALRLAPLVRVWPGESQHKRAVLGLDVLRMIGSDVALMQLNGIAQRLKFKALQQRARDAIDAIAAEKGMSKGELEDRIVPDGGLAADGTRSFDYGPRRFAFALGPGMKPMLRDDTGTLRPSPPKPRADDDAELAAQAGAEWKLMRKTITEAVKVQTARLEQAMVGGRRWSAEDFTTLLAGHPLQRHLIRLLVLGAYRDGVLATTFRLTEEGDLADVGDAPFALAEDDLVGIVHPLDLAAADGAQWGDVLADYELLPPFPQLGRAVFDVTAAELAEVVLTGFAGPVVPPASLVGTLERLDWTRGQPQDAGAFHLHGKHFPGANCTVIVEYEDGVWVGALSEGPDQRVVRVYALAGEVDPKALGYGDGRGLRWREVAPVVRSEVLADVHAVLAKARG